MLKDVLLRLTMTQKELAIELNMHPNTVNKWFTGRLQTPKWVLQYLKYKEAYDFMNELRIKVNAISH